MESLFFFLYLIFWIWIHGVQTDTKRLHAVFHTESILRRARFFFMFFLYILLLHGRCYGEKEEERGFFVYRIRDD